MVAYSRTDWSVPRFKVRQGYKHLDFRASEDVDWTEGYRPYPMFVAYFASLQRLGITILHCAPNEFGTTFGALWRWTVKKSHSRKIRRVKILPPEHSALLALSTALSQNAAGSILDEFGNRQSVLIQYGDTLVQVAGIGQVSSKELVSNG